ncbi:MAG: DUF1501 domain-containing protein [Candidatus Hydrogenedentes bacterium]|nr:DUF1501 domain-containing protein [Candidatus Hydrogenedentota bacterium]
MDPIRERILRSRREFLAASASGIGGVALASLLMGDGLAAHAEAPAAQSRLANPLATTAPHFAPTAKACIFIFLEGGPSQIDLFDPKPKLNELHGQKPPASFTEKARFAFIQRETAVLMGSPRKFRRYGQCGMELSDLLPHTGACADDICLIRSMRTDALHHHPGQLMMNTGAMTFGRPTVGAWLNYGLGSESQNLPGYVVLSAGRGTSGGASNWSSGFLPPACQGVPLRYADDTTPNLNNPQTVSPDFPPRAFNPHLGASISAYESAFRSQAAAPDLLDFSHECQATLHMYGVNRRHSAIVGARGGRQDEFRAFAANCLLARRLVERGVRFINLYHASWDHHSGLDAGLEFNCAVTDQPVAALIRDLKQRGLLDTTLVVWGGEFGRTPLGENRPGTQPDTGRDHHPSAFTIWMAGGGIKGGQVIGRTDDLGWNIVEDPIHIADLHATMMRMFGLDHSRLVYRRQDQDIHLNDGTGNVIHKLLA